MPDRRLRVGKLVLLIVNLLAFPLLALPAYGFIHYMDLHGYYTFTLTGWCGIILTAVYIWPGRMRRSGLRRYFFLLIAAYVSCVIAWAAGVHKLIFPVTDVQHAWSATLFALLAGGPVTAAYWLTASLVNFLVLRHLDRRLCELR